MSLSNLIKKRVSDDVATATFATHGQGKGATVATVTVANAQKTEFSAGSAFTDWLIHFDQSELGVIIPDGATREQVKALYPAAVKVEPIQRPPSRQATAAEKAELWRLVNTVLTDAPEEIGEAFTAGLADIECALVCYRSLTIH